MLLRTARREGNRISFLWRDILRGSAWSILALGLNEKTGLNTAIPSIPSHHSNSKVALAGNVSGLVAPRPESSLNHLSQTLDSPPTRHDFHLLTETISTFWLTSVICLY
jgi:hypothetical protein